MSVQLLVEDCAVLTCSSPVELASSIVQAMKARGYPVPTAMMLSIAGQDKDLSLESIICGSTTLTSVLPLTLSTLLVFALRSRASPVAKMLTRFDGGLGNSTFAWVQASRPGTSPVLLLSVPHSQQCLSRTLTRKSLPIMISREQT